jgi:hypothetical protein
VASQAGSRHSNKQGRSAQRAADAPVQICRQHPARRRRRRDHPHLAKHRRRRSRRRTAATTTRARVAGAVGAPLLLRHHSVPQQRTHAADAAAAQRRTTTTTTTTTAAVGISESDDLPDGQRLERGELQQRGHGMAGSQWQSSGGRKKTWEGG